MAATIGEVVGILTLRDQFTTVLTRASTQLAKTGKRLEQTGQRMAQVGGQLTTAITLPLAAIGIASVKFATDFESSFAGVRKTVNATEEEFAKLAKGLRQLAREEVPIDVNDLNRIAEAAGQLGIQTENILSFTRTIADIGVATNLTVDQAASDFARLANITGLPQTKFENLGSAIVALGNTFATTEQEILDFGLRIAGAGEIAGLTEADILGIGTAMTSVGVQSEAGGTAVQKVLLGMVKASEEGGKKLEVFAKTAGLSASEFARVFKQDAAEAFKLFVEGLGRQGTKAFRTLDELNLKDQRLIRSFISLAGAGDLLRRAMEEGNVAFAENTALAEEAEKRYATFASQLTFVWNRIKDVAISLGQALTPALKGGLELLSPWIDRIASLVRVFSDLPVAAKGAIIAFAALAAAFGPVLFISGQLISAFGQVMTLAPQMAKAVALATGPWGLLALAIVAVTVALSEWIRLSNKSHALLLKNIAITNDYGKAAFLLRKEIHEATKEQRALNAEILKGVTIPLPKLEKELAKAIVKLADMSETTGKFTRILSGMGAGQMAVVKTTAASSAKIKEQQALVKDLELKLRGANDALDDAANLFGLFGDEIDDVNDTLDDHVNVVDDTVVRLDFLGDSLEGFEDVVNGVDEATSGWTGTLLDNGEAIDAADRRLALLALTAIDATRSFEEIEAVQRLLSAALGETDISAEDMRAALERLGKTTDEAAESTSKLFDGFGEAIAKAVLDAESLGDALKVLFEGTLRQSLTGFVTVFLEGFDKIFKSGEITVSGIKDLWNEAKKNLLGVANAIAAGFAASFGRVKDIAIAALTAVVNFLEGNVVAGVLAVIGVVAGLAERFGRDIQTAIDIAKKFGLVLSVELLASIDGLSRGLRDLNAAFLIFLGSTIRELGISSLRDLQLFLMLTTDLLGQLATAARRTGQAMGDMSALVDDMNDSGLTQAEVISALGDTLGEITRRFLAAGGGLAEFNDLIGLFVDLLDEVAKGNITAARAGAILGTVMSDLVEIAIALGADAVAGIQAIVDAAIAAGVETSVFADALEDAFEAVFRVLEARNEFILKQGSAIISGLGQMFADSAGLTKRHVEFAATAILTAFAAMQAAGAPILTILDELGDAFAAILDRGLEIGADLPDAFLRLGEILDVLASKGIARMIDQLAGLSAATAALGNLGSLSAGQFDLFGDSIRRAFRKLMREGLTAEEALAILAPQLQLLNDLSQQYGFELDKNTQRLLDQAMAQGLVADKGLTTEDILIRGFDKMLEALNALIVALGGVPIEFERWGDAVPTNEVSSRMGLIAVAHADAADATARAWKGAMDSVADSVSGLSKVIGEVIGRVGSLKNSIADAVNRAGVLSRVVVNAGVGSPPPPKFGGSRGFVDFGTGTSAVLHGREQALTESEGLGIVGMIEAVLNSGNDGDETGTSRVLLELERIAEGVEALGARR